MKLSSSNIIGAFLVAFAVLNLYIFPHIHSKKCETIFVEVPTKDNSVFHGRHIYIITPTYPRLSQRPDLVRMIESVRSAERGGQVTWIVVDDANSTSIWNQRLFAESELSDVIYTHELTPISHNKTVARGGPQRNRGLQIVYERVCNQQYSLMDYPIIYFADDDNTYDHRLWKLFREHVIRIGVVNVGMVQRPPIPIEGPITETLDSGMINTSFPLECGKGSLSHEEKMQVLHNRSIMTKLIGWSSKQKLKGGWTPDKRPFPIDMAGIAISARELCIQGIRDGMPNLFFNYTGVQGVLEVPLSFPTHFVIVLQANFIGIMLPNVDCAFDAFSMQGIPSDDTFVFHTKDGVYRFPDMWRESWSRNKD